MNDKCPFDGDTANDCAGCAYSGDYHFDKATGDCIARKENNAHCSYCGSDYNIEDGHSCWEARSGLFNIKDT